ncbi:DUF3040 domain-containing protein [Streptacidiphilus sp. PB12-B1b]|uniref:DUF3040 domain-containing protein n=1 Tax=Streptacidiphilus sp. PB12-B1b TaxID=2705012 RepID=UPI0015F80F76|nr:DUF3040 domain-containing protein [Streptacidiphilus sp. PB12-B1b]QMU74805.1 DUF3040 domain-containing protein [Streptacidiphilus sp. PB12-B1b]
MGLSEDDRRALRDIEQGLDTQDPHLAFLLSSLGRERPLCTLIRVLLPSPRVWWLAATTLLSITLLAASTSTRNWYLAIAGAAAAALGILPEVRLPRRWTGNRRSR